MKKFLDRARSALNTLDNKSTDNPSATLQALSPPIPPSQDQAPTSTDIIRFRYHHGTNLGSVFVLEKWLHGSMFDASSSGDSELDAVSASVNSIGLVETKNKWNAHWNNALLDHELDWLVTEAKCTSIRLPIGFFTLGARFSKGSRFEAFEEIYEGAWEIVKKLVKKCSEAGIGVLIDLHALPGGANKDAHSGSGTGKAELWEKRKNRDIAKECIKFVVEEVSKDWSLRAGVVGVQIVNEAAYRANGMFDWYEDVLASVARIDSTIPIYVSDAWECASATDWAKKRKNRGLNPVILDTHCYYTFSDEHRRQSPRQIIERVPQALAGTDGISVVVGEYSCVLDGQTWSKIAEHEKEEYVRLFGQVQSQTWQKAAAGSYFWTFKMDWMEGGEWGFVEQTRKGNIRPPSYMTISHEEVQLRITNAAESKNGLAANARRSHEEHWNKAAPGKKMEHGRYSDGWSLGFDDASFFFSSRSNRLLGDRQNSGADKLGCLDAWLNKRSWEAKQEGEFAWEWSQGFCAGVQAFERTVGIEA